MFRTTHAVTLFEHLRIPYTADLPRDAPDDASLLDSGFARLQIAASSDAPRGPALAGGPATDGPSVWWPYRGNQVADRTPRIVRSLLGDIPLYTRVVPDAALAPLLGSDAHGWQRSEPLRDSAGQLIASVWRADDGSLLLPFDPDEAIETLWSERYRESSTAGPGRVLRRLGLATYYRLRPLMPRAVQLALRREFSRVQGRTSFPRWPVEPALHDLFRHMVMMLADFAAAPIPWIQPWPAPYAWCLSLTHDVETEAGLVRLAAVRALEMRAGVRSVWNFVPRRYEVPASLVDGLLTDGFEVGVHGLYHDGRDLESWATLQARLPAMHESAALWQAGGFRAPSTHRRWEWVPELGFDYDSSYPDTDPYEPQPGGCCSWFPFLIGGTVELPITLPQDHTLFTILQHADERLWVDKCQRIRARQGLALLLAHPDYMLHDEDLAMYERFLGAFADDLGAWRPLPREIAAWWRRRDASRIEIRDGGWRVVGPAADEAQVSLEPPA
jgi:hypothetical protein